MSQKCFIYLSFVLLSPYPNTEFFFIYRETGHDIFYLRDVVSAVLATATCLAGWLAGWVAGCPSHASIVSKRLNLSEKKFSTIWKHRHSSFLRPLRRYKIPRGTPSAGALNTRGWGKLAIFVQFSTDIAVYLGNGAI